jgi:2-polyprenyl-3-methyl-5-hydroxy-6-metoxy-1,4-benzoquinol methylase
MIRTDVRKVLKAIINPRPPRELTRNFRSPAADRLEPLEDALRKKYFTRPIWGDAGVSAGYLDTEIGRSDLADHMQGRLEHFRTLFIPWLNQARPLRGARILEIGCGTGSSTVALAEQGAVVTAIDLDESSLEVAKTRLRAYELDADLQIANATETADRFSSSEFDFIIFFAALEHMTHAERMQAMSVTWRMLRSGGLWALTETPNRLWYFDSHTSWLPFFMWLPDELAFAYSRYSPRQPLSLAFRAYSEPQMLSFLRHGRGVSFHEFEFTLGPVETLNVISSLEGYLQQRSWRRYIAQRLRRETRYKSFIRRLCPKVHDGFFDLNLDLIVRK